MADDLHPTAQRKTMPAQGRAHDDILRELESLKVGDPDWKGGKVWSLVYHAGDAHEELLKDAHQAFMSQNGLNPMAFKGLKQMDADVVSMTASMLNAPETAVGSMTSGGTESILLAVLAARERARSKWPWITSPEIVVPETIHVAFDKAAHYFGLKVRYAPIGDDCRVNVKKLKALVGRNTVLIAASAPQYPHGVVDPIEEIGAFAAKKKIPFHVDGCVGGFLLPWLEKLGHPLPVFDFRVPGVTSMSADVHKYGFAAKGASVVVYRSMDYMKHQFFVSTDWPGGVYASATIPGTRPGGSIAAAWASMMAMGESGYLEHTRKALEATKKLQAGVEKIEGLKVLGPPDATIVTFVSTDKRVSIFAVADQMQAKGWHVDRQQNPDSIHCTVTSNHLSIVDGYLDDLAASVDYVRHTPGLEASGEAAMYGMMAKVPVRSMVKWTVRKVMEQMYAPGGGSTDLSKVGEGDGDGPVMKAMAKYGPKALEVLDKVEDVRAKVLPRRGRRS